MSSSELIGSHVYSPQQLSTREQQYGTHHQLQTKKQKVHGSTVFPQHLEKKKSTAVKPSKHIQEEDVANTNKKVRR